MIEEKNRSIRGKWDRFMSRRKARAEAVPQNRRRFHRFQCTLPVELHLETPGHLSIIKAVARNISAGGMLIECATIPALMSACHVAFQVPEWGPFKTNRNRLVMAEARVQHCDRTGMNFGLAFASPL
jgi:hypothetical protein